MGALGSAVGAFAVVVMALVVFAVVVVAAFGPQVVQILQSLGGVFGG